MAIIKWRGSFQEMGDTCKSMIIDGVENKMNIIQTLIDTAKWNGKIDIWNKIMGDLTEQYGYDEECICIRINGNPIDSVCSLNYIPHENDEILISNKVSGAGGDLTDVFIAVAAVTLVAIGQGWALPGLIAAGGSMAVALTSIGLGLGVGLIMKWISPQPKPPGFEQRENKSSEIFNGIRNTIDEGAMMPVGYGRNWAGGAIISLRLKTEDFTPV